jgi:hypothetical protein
VPIATPTTIEAPRQPGCLRQTVRAVVWLALVVGTALVGARIYSHHGSGAARTSYLEQRRTIQSALRELPLPPFPRLTLRDGSPVGGPDSIIPHDADRAEKGYVRARNPLREITDLRCADGCPDEWRPPDGVSGQRSLQVGRSAAQVCDIERALLAARPFAPLVLSEAAPVPRGSVCRFTGTYEREVFLTLDIRAIDAPATSILIKATTRKRA